MTTLSFPKMVALQSIENIIADFESSDNEEVTLDFSAVEYIDTGSANYFLLFPFLFGDRVKAIKVDNQKDSYKFLKKVGIIQELENNFRLVDDNEIAVELKQSRLKTLIKTNQMKAFDALSSSPFLRTFLASNDKNRNILKTLSKEYKHILNPSSLNEFKVSTCLIELIDNVFQHSKEREGAISVHFVENNKIPFLFITVTDLGVGFKHSLLQSKNYATNTEQQDAFYIEQALKSRVTSTDSLGRGLGLPTVVKNCDRVSISSGFGNVTIFNDAESHYNNVRNNKFYIQGANVVCIVRLDDHTILDKKKQ